MHSQGGMVDKSVLLAEDDADIREALRDLLTDEGYLAIEAANGQEALDYLRSHAAPSLIVLDWNMGPVSGPEFMAEVARDPRLATVPVLLMTADVNAGEKSDAHPFAGYLVKPVDVNALFDAVRRHSG